MDYLSIHKKWGEYWAKAGTNKFDINSKRPKYYCLQMFPYPSGANLHLGHYFNYAVSDTHARFKRMTGFNVFQPFGFDSFGLPAENFAIKTNTQPRANTTANIEIMKRQIDELGHMHDWDYAVDTCDVEYYKWTQWLFIELFNAGLAYQRDALVNWCGKCNTVLANEQVLAGECERCQTMVVRVNKKQWFFKITDFAEELLAGLDNLDWPEKTKTMQRNWIGKSTGSNVKWPLVGHDGAVDTYTTRIDTLFGTTFLVVAPEHPVIELITTAQHKAKVDKYIKAATSKSDIERMEYSKTGVFTGGYATNPATKEHVPVYVADYVLYTYGTGAVLGVPAHDYRDFDFAKEYGLEIRYVLKEKGKAAGNGTEATCCGHYGLENFELINGNLTARQASRL
jgi:leucyl-tRNA synthetase